MSQVSTMLPNRLHCTLYSPASATPTAITLPIWQWVELTGMPDHEAKTTLRVDPSSIQKPLKKLTWVKFVPTVCITLAPYKLRPCNVAQSQAGARGTTASCRIMGYVLQM